jgi:hypothetical protein
MIFNALIFSSTLALIASRATGSALGGKIYQREQPRDNRYADQ